MASKSYKRRIAASKAELDAALLADARRFGHHGAADFVEIARQRHNAAITLQYAADLIARAAPLPSDPDAARPDRTSRELDAGLGQWVRDLIAARRAGNVDLAKRLRDDIRERCEALDLDESAVFLAFGDPDAPANGEA